VYDDKIAKLSLQVPSLLCILSSGDDNYDCADDDSDDDDDDDDDDGYGNYAVDFDDDNIDVSGARWLYHLTKHIQHDKR